MNLARTLTVPSLLLVSLAAIACSSDDSGSGSTGGAGPTAGAAGMSAGGSPSGGMGTAGAAAGSGGMGTGGAAGGTGGSGGPPMGVPPSDSEADIVAFIKSGAYKNAPWRATSDMPLASTSHMGKVKIWMNPPLVDSLKNMRSGMASQPKPDQYSMAVKELLDEAGTAVVGHAVIYRAGAESMPPSWSYTCVSPDPARCAPLGGTASMAVYGKGTSGQTCFNCHSAMLQPILSMPPP